MFAVWSEKGIKTFSDLYINSQLASFAQLSNKFHLPNSHFFRYLQFRHYVEENRSDSTPTTHPFLETFLLPPDSKQLISKCVGSFTKSVSSDFIREAWSKDLNSEISAELWEEALSRVHCCSLNSCYKLIQYKGLHRLHYSKTELNLTCPSVSPVCDKCHIAEGSLVHLFWFYS